jgi:predicted amidohydrolase
VRILLAALCCEKGALDRNLGAHRRAMEQAREEGCALAVFPEMSLTGSVDAARTPERLIALDHPAVTTMAQLTDELGVAALFGLAEAGPYITQVLAAHGGLEGLQRKRHLGEDEAAYRAADEDAVFALDGARFAVAICAESGIDRPFLYARSVSAPLVCFCAAPGLYERRTSENEWRAGWDWWGSAGLADTRRHAREHGLWIAIATQAGATVDEDFPGLAALVDPRGEVVAQLPDWNAGTLVVDVPV